jgi:hypothetical protein
MSIQFARAPFSLRKFTVLAAGLGLLTVGGIGVALAVDNAGGGGADCPQWTTPVCRHWNLGPPPSCSEWACAADKKSDPPKAQVSNPPRRPRRPEVLTTPGLLEQSPGLPTQGPASTGQPSGVILR